MYELQIDTEILIEFVCLLRRPSTTDDQEAYWVSFLDGTQRVLLFTNERFIANEVHSANRLDKVPPPSDSHILLHENCMAMQTDQSIFKTKSNSITDAEYI